MKPLAPAILVAGVSGCGKSTVGRVLAQRLGSEFLDADDFHPPGNIEKMASGVPLTDADRLPWLEALAGELAARRARGRAAVLACSALKESYRAVLRRAVPDLLIVYLKGDYELIAARMRARQGHFMDARMLQSQYADLEEPAGALTFDVTLPVQDIVEAVLDRLAPQGRD